MTLGLNQKISVDAGVELNIMTAKCRLKAALAAFFMLKEVFMFIVYRLLKLAVICAIFFTIYDLIEMGKVTWPMRFFGF